MNILVTHGSKRGGTAGIASRIADILREAGLTVDVLPAREVRSVRDYDAVLVGGALYAMRWHGEARRFVLRHLAALRERPVWFFSSGPLDDSADQKEIPPTPMVRELMDVVGASGHATFGGRLERDAHGFIASSMAKKRAGDWRDPAHIEAWARGIAATLEAGPAQTARPSPKPLPPRSWLLPLCAAVAVTALPGGAALIARSDGSLVQMPLLQLQHSPFHDFLVPGLLLFVVIGLGNAWAAYLHAVRGEFASLASFVTGAGLVVWIVVEMIMLRSAHWLQVTYLIAGLSIVAESLREARQMLGPAVGPQPAAR